METTDARQWQYVPTNSPQPLPKTNYILHQNNLAPVTLGELSLGEISLAELIDFCSKGMVEGAQLSDYLRQNNQHPMAETIPLSAATRWTGKGQERPPPGSQRRRQC